jgi:hypothetical protein
LNDAICAAIAAEHEHILDHLLLFYATYMPTPRHPTYNTWVEATLKTGNLDILKRVLQAKRLGSTYIATSVFNAACKPKAVHMLPALLASFPNANPHRSTTSISSLFIAARSGCVAAVAAILDTDPEVNINLKRQRPSPRKSYTPLE